jgi:hypothetical protein
MNYQIPVEPSDHDRLVHVRPESRSATHSGSVGGTKRSDVSPLPLFISMNFRRFDVKVSLFVNGNDSRFNEMQDVDSIIFHFSGARFGVRKSGFLAKSIDKS